MRRGEGGSAGRAGLHCWSMALRTRGPDRPGPANTCSSGHGQIASAPHGPTHPPVTRTAALVLLCRKGLCRPLQAGSTSEADPSRRCANEREPAAHGARQRRLSQQNAAAPLCRKPSRHSTPLPTAEAGQGGSSHLLILRAPACRSWDRHWECDQDQASGAERRHGYDAISPAAPSSRGGSAATYRGPGATRPPQQQHPWSPSALTGDSTRKGAGEPAPVLKCRGVSEENKPLVSDNRGHIVCRGLAALAFSGLLPPMTGLLGGSCRGWGAQELRFPHVPLAAKSSPTNASCHGSQHHYFLHNRNKKNPKSLLRRARARTTQRSSQAHHSCPAPLPLAGSGWEGSGVPRREGCSAPAPGDQQT